MREFFTSGRIADLIVLLMVVEGVLLIAYRRRTGRGIAGRALWGNLASGACLLLALRGALVGAHWTWIALALAGALVAHLADLRCRWREHESLSLTGPIRL